MITDFQHYLETPRPVLENALREALSGLLGGITVKDAACLMTSLEAGKKIRGYLTCMITQALGGTLEAAIPRATSVELIQAATLIHDDIVDQDTVRRGRPAVWTVEGARRAVLIGDVIFASAIEMMSDLSKEDGLAVSRAIAQVAQGALREPLDPLVMAAEIESGCSDAGEANSKEATTEVEIPLGCNHQYKPTRARQDRDLMLRHSMA